MEPPPAYHTSHCAAVVVGWGMENFDVIATTKRVRDVTEGLRGGDIQYVSMTPEPGTVCPTCGEKTPTKHALEMRKFRARKRDA